MAIGLLFEQLVDLLLLLAITVIIALPISAGASWFERFRVPRALGALICMPVELKISQFPRSF